ncbi:glutathione S-transferase N-terminal domain-containing protein [Microvirga makkahensis]|uniref:Glutathione S-transferase n=1 Tax=Microvirga makkahensis TaxID=1128670 RepID=A0A7X3MX30_9HYPH|nr:glutathione S-transferase [Microvirga makkahensis]
MRLFHSPASPYVRKVMVTAYERGVEDQIEILGSAAGPVKRDPEIVKHNSSGKVPCALLENDTPLFDSRVICAYLDSLAGREGTVYPQGADRFDVLTLEALGDAILDACLLCRYEAVLRPESLRWDDWYAGQMAKVDSGLDDLEGKWFERISGAFHAGSIAVVCALGYLDFRFSDKDWRSTHPKLAAWFAEVSERRSMKETLPKG